MSAPTAINSEAEILSRVIVPDGAGLSDDAARSILALCFDQRDIDRMDDLAEKARQGALAAGEKAELESYERVGSLLGILHSKARLSLKNAPASG